MMPLGRPRCHGRTLKGLPCLRKAVEQPSRAYYMYCHDHLKRWKEFEPRARAASQVMIDGTGNKQLKDLPDPPAGASTDPSNHSPTPRTPRQMTGRSALNCIAKALGKRGAEELGTPPKLSLGPTNKVFGDEGPTKFQRVAKEGDCDNSVPFTFTYGRGN